MQRQFTVEISRNGGKTYGIINRFVTVTAYSAADALINARLRATDPELLYAKFEIVDERETVRDVI